MRDESAVYVGNPADIKGKSNLDVVSIASKKRLKSLPDAPTFIEQGFELDESMWRGFAFKKGVPVDFDCNYECSGDHLCVIPTPREESVAKETRECSKHFPFVTRLGVLGVLRLAECVCICAVHGRKTGGGRHGYPWV